MSILEKSQTLVILMAVVFGLLLGQINVVESYAGGFIIPFLLLMLYGLFLSIPLKNIKTAFKNIKFMSISSVINFLWTPLLAWGLGSLFLSDNPALWLGFILLLVTPCTDWYLIFTSIAKGNVSLATSVLPVNLILQVILLPVYLFIFAGTMQIVEFTTIIESVVLVLFLPLLLANLTRFLLKNKKEVLDKKIIPIFGYLQIIFLSLAIVAMFASQGSHLLGNFEVIIIMVVPLLLFFIINFIVGQTIGKVLNFSYEDTTSLNLTIIARNSPIALAIVITAFPNEPLIALALVVGPLIELPVLALISQVLLAIRRKTYS